MKAVNILIGLLVGYVFTMILELNYNLILKRTKKHPVIVLKGYHIHHSIYGAIMLPLALILSAPILLGAGAGIITRHTQAEKKFKFIEKEEKVVYKEIC
ncbi:MAG: hypothetical protein ABIC91_01275 [Nanoarchaeota archaeon]|nr:hypothetical protein [Nanoarchaeota archaeon]MBU1029835.1 hypothetical protein [Nanoarchaeota archaeon]MBU1849497.1 hypothetical protein [Nanoarchaeota archaeon]